MTFIKFTNENKRNGKLCKEVRINFAGMSIAEDVFAYLGSPDSISVFYDLENKSIKLEVGTGKDSYLVSNRKSTLTKLLASKSFGKKMPYGRYEQIEKGIFKLKEEK